MSDELYRTKVLAALKQARAEGKPVTFSNTGPAHASIVLDVMVAESSHVLDVISGCLDRAVWSSETLRKFIDRGGRVRVVLDEAPDGKIPQNSVLWDLLHEVEGSIQLGWIREPLGVHLCVADGEHVRLEKEHRRCEADVTFGDKDLASAATRVFDRIWSSQLQPMRELA